MHTDMNNMVKVVDIVLAQSITHIDASTSIIEMEYQLSTSIVTSFDASITGDNSTVPYSFRTSGWSWHMACSVRAIYSTSLALFIHGITSAKRAGQWYSSEKVARSF